MVESPDAGVLGAAAIVFIMPLIFGGLGYFAAAMLGAAEMICAAVAAVGFVLSLVILRIINGASQKKGPTLRIVKIIEKDGHSPECENDTV